MTNNEVVSLILGVIGQVLLYILIYVGKKRNKWLYSHSVIMSTWVLNCKLEIEGRHILEV